MKKLFILCASFGLVATANAQIFCPDIIHCIKNNGDVSCTMKPYTGHWGLDHSHPPSNLRGTDYQFVLAIIIDNSAKCFYKVNAGDSDTETWKTYSKVNLSKSGPNWQQKGALSTCEVSVQGCAFVQIPQ